MNELRQKHPLATLLRAAQLPRSTFYYQQKACHRPTPYAPESERIASIFHHHKGRYGYRRITMALRKQKTGEAPVKPLNHKTVQKLMQAMRLSSCIRRKKYSSYKGSFGQAAPNVLQRNFHAEQPNQKWVTDVTEFNVRGVKLYLSPVLDLYNSEIIAYQMGTSPAQGLVGNMLKKALKKLKPGEKVMLHSDQGWQYQTIGYQRTLSGHGIEQSMSRKGNCLDNAVVENFFGILKSECWYNYQYSDVNTLKMAIDEYIHYYNHERIKAKLGGLSPVQYRAKAHQNGLMI